MENITWPKALKKQLWNLIYKVRQCVLAPLHSFLCAQQEEATLLKPRGQCQMTDQRWQSEVYRQLKKHGQLLEATQ